MLSVDFALKGAIFSSFGLPVAENSGAISFMCSFTIESIQKTKCWINGIQSHLDHPTPEVFQRRVYSISFQGWVASFSEEIADICLSCMDCRIVSAQLTPRIDVQQAYPQSKYTTGFEVPIVPIALGQDQPMDIVLTTKDGRYSSLFEIYLRFHQDTVQTEVTASKLPTFALIVAGGRSGTAFLSQLLLRSNAILGLDEYPYEARLASRLAIKWFSELQPAHYHSMCDEEDVDPGFRAIHSIVMNCGGDTQHLEAMTALTDWSRQQECKYITQLYRLLSPRKTASVIVEKFISWLSFLLTRRMFPNFRPIFLVRDPRDHILSVRNFNEKRANYMFHEENSLLEHVQLFAMHASRLAWVYDQYKDVKLLVKYEDLVRNPLEVMREVFDYLEINHSSQEIAKFLRESPVRDEHVTSSSPEASIGRWRRELSEGQKALLNRTFQPIIDRFDY
jgi:hypothetical protein